MKQPDENIDFYIATKAEAEEHMASCFELYGQIKEGLDDIANGNTRPFAEAMADIRSKRKR